jgi:hydrogenase maturation factor
MIAGGKLLDRYYTGTTIKHVNEEARKTLNSLQEFFRQQ